MKLTFITEIELPDDATLIEAHDVAYEIKEHIHSWRSDLPITSKTDVRVSEQITITIR